MQTKLQSMIETTANYAIGMTVSFIAQLIIYPILKIEVNLHQNVVMVCYFTVISVVRSYYVRRLFNHLHRPAT
jgi:hypothetical protein